MIATKRRRAAMTPKQRVLRRHPRAHAVIDVGANWSIWRRAGLHALSNPFWVEADAWADAARRLR